MPAKRLFIQTVLNQKGKEIVRMIIKIRAKLRYRLEVSTLSKLAHIYITARKAHWIVLSCTVKCTLVQALRLCTGRTTHRWSGGIALPFHDHDTRMWGGVSVTPRPLFISGKNPVPIVQEAGWDPGPVWTGAENPAPHRDSIPGPSSPWPVAIPTELPGPRSIT